MNGIEVPQSKEEEYTWNKNGKAFAAQSCLVFGWSLPKSLGPQLQNLRLSFNHTLCTQAKGLLQRDIWATLFCHLSTSPLACRFLSIHIHRTVFFLTETSMTDVWDKLQFPSLQLVCAELQLNSLPILFSSIYSKFPLSHLPPPAGLSMIKLVMWKP